MTHQPQLGPRLRLNDMAPNITVIDSEGQSQALAALWSEKPLVLAFLRHFG